ncbi:MAG: iron-sulfur cluster assembly scaffold protein [Candidatus Anstonellales archaeon]
MVDEDFFENYERLINIYKRPKNAGKLKDANVIIHEKNESCGDEVKIYLLVKDGIIMDASFEGEGCVISKASTSLLLDHLKGKYMKDIDNIDKAFIFSLIGIDLSKNPSRIKCATLALNALKKNLK